MGRRRKNPNTKGAGKAEAPDAEPGQVKLQQHPPNGGTGAGSTGQSKKKPKKKPAPRPHEPSWHPREQRRTGDAALVPPTGAPTRVVVRGATA